MAMETARTGFNEARTNHEALLADQRAFLTQAADNERALIVDIQIKNRDQLLIDMLNGNWSVILKDDVTRRSEKLLGKPTIIDESDRAFEAFNNAQDVLADLQRDVDWSSQNVRRSIERLEQLGDKVTQHCLEKGAPEVEARLAEPTSEKSRNALFVLKSACRAYDRELKDLNKKRAAVATNVSGVFVPFKLDDWPVCDDTEKTKNCAGGEIYKTATELAPFDDLMAMQALLAWSTKQTLAELQLNYQCALQEKLPAEAFEANVAAAAGLVRDFVGLLSAIENDPESAGDPEKANETTPAGAAMVRDDANVAATAPPAATGLVAGACGDRNPPKFPTLSDFLEGSGLEPDEIGEVFGRLARLNASEAFAASVRKALAEYKLSEAATILDALADHEAGSTIEADDAKVRAALYSTRLIGLFQQLAAAEAGTLPDRSAILVDIAFQEYVSGQADIELQRLQSLRDLKALELEAMISEVRLLNLAERERKQEQRTKAIRRYANSWKNGRIQQSLFDTERRFVDRFARQDHEEQAVGTMYAMIDPALNELQVYASGGVSAELIARYLNLVGVGAIAYGVNN